PPDHSTTRTSSNRRCLSTSSIGAGRLPGTSANSSPPRTMSQWATALRAAERCGVVLREGRGLLRGSGMDLELTGKRTIVTGGSRGIGLAVARALAAEGSHVALVARDAAVLAAARQAGGAAPSAARS